MRSKLMLLAVALALAACANTKPEMEPWVGQTEDQLVAKWGAPTRETRTASGTRVFSYGKFNPTGGLICMRNFVIGTDNKVKSYSHDCPL